MSFDPVALICGGLIGYGAVTLYLQRSWIRHDVRLYAALIMMIILGVLGFIGDAIVFMIGA